MKKLFSMTAVVATALLALTSCSDSNREPQRFDVLISTGAFITNCGSQDKTVDGSLTLFDYQKNSTSQNVYRIKNNESLGSNVTDAIAYGSKLYIVGSDKKTIFVAKANTVEKIVNIPTGEYTPRHIAASGDKVYVSTYNNKVLAIDTLSCMIEKMYDCGNYSEGIKAIGKYVITADSNLGNGKDGASITVINTDNSKIDKYQNENIVYPTDILTYVDGYGRLHIYHLDAGTIDAKGNQTGYGIYELSSEGKSHKKIEATMAAIGTNGYMYIVNAPVTNPATAAKYQMVNLDNGFINTFTDGKDIASPAAIAVDGTDPYNNLVFISSYNKVDGSVSYSTPGYAMIYNANGSSNKRIEAGVGPASICFRYTVETVVIN